MLEHVITKKSRYSVPPGGSENLLSLKAAGVLVIGHL